MFMHQGSKKSVGGVLALINDAFLIILNYQHENTASVYEQ